MRNVLLAVLIAFVCVSVMACGGGNAPGNTSGGGANSAAADNSTPEGLIKLQTAAVEAMDADKMSSWFVPEERADMKTTFEGQFKKMKEGGAVTVSVKFTNLKVDGDNGTADMEIIAKDKDGKDMPSKARPVKMVKKDGKWWSKK